MKLYDNFITTVILLKFSFICLEFFHIYNKINGTVGSDYDKIAVYYKERFEFIFKSVMAGLLIYIFNPFKNNSKSLDHETKILFYLYGFVLIITSNWDLFLKESKLFRLFQKMIL